jgi:hypothetical protein
MIGMKSLDEFDTQHGTQIGSQRTEWNSLQGSLEEKVLPKHYIDEMFQDQHNNTRGYNAD